jgi:hypothetical protein
MSDSQLPAKRAADEAEDLGMYGIVWLGLIAAATGVVIGLIMMFSPEQSMLGGASTAALSVALGSLIYLVSKVLDRQ